MLEAQNIAIEGIRLRRKLRDFCKLRPLFACDRRFTQRSICRALLYVGLHGVNFFAPIRSVRILACLRAFVVGVPICRNDLSMHVFDLLLLGRDQVRDAFVAQQGDERVDERLQRIERQQDRDDHPDDSFERRARVERRDDQVAKNRHPYRQEASYDQADDSAAPAMDLAIDQRGRQNVPDNDQDVHDSAGDVARDDAVEERCHHADDDARPRTVCKTAHHDGDEARVVLQERRCGKNRKFDERENRRQSAE